MGLITDESESLVASESSALMKLITDKAGGLCGKESSALVNGVDLDAGILARAENSGLVNGVDLDVSYISYLKKLIVDGSGCFIDSELVDDLDLHGKTLLGIYFFFSVLMYYDYL
ncbi:hypothetical protein CEXT_332011 [Caerostris extrusa]|uniref:Uncharacterized protein n=1 Tax=Caerostris extrusa TaxID=172846 RepID=A0AAV4RM19_CAEEX|nr:hypothetical protein CEXT_332011 [Caerostris extrusa]